MRTYIVIKTFFDDETPSYFGPFTTYLKARAFVVSDAAPSKHGALQEEFSEESALVFSTKDVEWVLQRVWPNLKAERSYNAKIEKVKREAHQYAQRVMTSYQKNNGVINNMHDLAEVHQMAREARERYIRDNMPPL